jgi:hypothetical protein
MSEREMMFFGWSARTLGTQSTVGADFDVFNALSSVSLDGVTISVAIIERLQVAGGSGNDTITAAEDDDGSWLPPLLAGRAGLRPQWDRAKRVRRRLVPGIISH